MSEQSQIWIQQGVLYEIYLRSFSDATKDGVGTSGALPAGWTTSPVWG